ncbi:uncharacterized protein LOC128999895 [Macrosteles quadrilineatus]|uniref:uncharacterized protein LOC128999895 n=1 Tax=Macrosteles quadrilineatus TaxID=74068 RepID=UPI0023E0F3C6|nr:uncharacterized protein LOC128999895 [Macrosteles quadrilineatus]
MAYVIRFVNNCRHVDRSKDSLSSSELKDATNFIVKNIQQTHFSDDISAIKQGQLCSPRLRRLSPFIDLHQSGLLRVGGRLNRAPIDYDTKHPLLLPKNHHVVNLIINYYHKKHLHSGPQLTQALLCQHFWILSARSVIRSNILRCVTCFKHRPTNKTPLMGDLPTPRVNPSRPFLHTGVDYGGPFNVKIHNLRGNKTIKTYLCLFVCMATKAVHLKVVTDLTTDAFIASLTRFVSRRGLSSPNFGGLWEEAIKSAKYHINRVIGEHILTLPELMTLITQVEAMLNSRPLTPLSADPSDLTALTPGHFLIGAPLVAVPEVDLQDRSTYLETMACRIFAYVATTGKMDYSFTRAKPGWRPHPTSGAITPPSVAPGTHHRNTSRRRWYSACSGRAHQPGYIQKTCLKGLVI